MIDFMLLMKNSLKTQVHKNQKIHGLWLNITVNLKEMIMSMTARLRDILKTIRFMIKNKSRSDEQFNPVI